MEFKELLSYPFILSIRHSGGRQLADFQNPKSWHDQDRDAGQASMTDVHSFIAYTLIALFTIAGVIVSLHQYWQYAVYYYDFGIFDHAIWEVAHFQPPVIDHLVVGGKLIFADHFSPSLFLLSPLFWLFPQHETLLVAQAIIVGLSGVVLYRLAQVVVNNNFFALSILVSYVLFVGLQNAVITDIHDITFMTLPLLLCFYALATQRHLLYWISLLITLGCKESTFLIGVGIGIVIFLLYKRWRMIGIGTIILSVIYGLLTIKLIIPFFSGGIYQYGPGDLSPVSIVSHLFDVEVKRRTFLFSFLSFGFLPLLSPAFWFLFLQDFVTRFVPFWPTRWDLGLHYSAPIACFSAVASIYSLRLLQQKVTNMKILYGLCILLILDALFLYRVVLHGPFALAYNSAFYQHTKDFTFLDTMVAHVPPEASVMAQNNIASHFTHQKVWILTSSYAKYMPDYIVIDSRSEQSPNDFFATDIPLSQIASMLTADKRYKIIYHTGDQYVFKKV